MSATIDYGIDLGTTNSSIACCRQGEVRVFQNADLMNVTPSVVYVSKTGRMLVGKKAYDTWIADPTNTQAEFKRWMGYSDRLTFPASGKAMSAEELSAEVLKSLRNDVQRLSQEMINSAVITVPAAFGSLQCDATAQAAKLAGLEFAPLLQEPIAAAIAHGADPSSANQRCMVFDLGGGTLDIAVVSTRHGRLAVLEHQGDNRLGGKDIDRTIAESFIIPALSSEFSLPTRAADPVALDRLVRILLRHAEQAKIALSTADEVTLELFDIGEDTEGKPIEATLKLSRAELEAKIEPLIDRCMSLAERALDGARLAKADLDRVLLVGGPTQMPIVRAALESRLGARLDHSQDPMTVVARGASMYASTLENPRAAAPPVSERKDAVRIQLSYERASGTPQSPVAGILPVDSGITEVKFDADGGFWTSGWIAVQDGTFQTELTLNNRRPSTAFTVSARGASGQVIAIDPSRFAITYMLPMSATPMPHAIAVELTQTDGSTEYDRLFERQCPLPAEARRTYRAERTLRPSEPEATLPIKFWEIDVSDDPQERWWAGCVHVRAEKITRPIPEGSELEMTVKVDASRKMTVEVFIPILNESFVDGVFVPDPPAATSQLQQQLDLCFARLDRAWQVIYEADRMDLRDRIHELQVRTESIYEQVTAAERDHAKGMMLDPDAALAPTEALRKIRVQLSQVEEQCETDSTLSQLARSMRGETRWTEQIVAHHGSPSDKTEMERLRPQMDRYIEQDDRRGMIFVRDHLRQLRGAILDHQPWFWQNVLSFLQKPGRKFLNKAEAMTWLKRAESANDRQNLPELREACCRVWDLQPPDQVEMAKEQAAQSGLRGN